VHAYELSIYLFQKYVYISFKIPILAITFKEEKLYNFICYSRYLNILVKFPCYIIMIDAKKGPQFFIFQPKDPPMNFKRCKLYNHYKLYYKLVSKWGHFERVTLVFKLGQQLFVQNGIKSAI